MRVVTLCANPAVDVSCSAEHVRPWHKLRTVGQTVEAGGGGINVARVLGVFGVEATVLYLAGGASGALLDEALARAGVAARRVTIAGDTRIAFNAHERVSGAEYRFVPEGPLVDAEEAGALADALGATALAAGDILVVSGSLPRGVPEDLYARLAREASARGVDVVVDTSGPALRAVLDGAEPLGLALVKPSVGELERVAGHALEQAGIAAVASELVRAGHARNVVVSMGSHGALLADDEGVVHAPAMRVAVRSAVGAGDSMVGALVARLARGESVRAAFPFGLAAGAACVLTPGAGLCTREDTERLHAQLLSAIASDGA